MERKLLNLLKASDWAEFQKFLRIDVGTVSETEEAEFFKKAQSLVKVPVFDFCPGHPAPAVRVMGSFQENLCSIVNTGTSCNTKQQGKLLEGLAFTFTGSDQPDCIVGIQKIEHEY